MRRSSFVVLASLVALLLGGCSLGDLQLGPTRLIPGEPVTVTSDTVEGIVTFRVIVPDGFVSVKVETIAMGRTVVTGRLGAKPVRGLNDCQGERSCTIASPAPGTYFFQIRTTQKFKNGRVLATLDDGIVPQPDAGAPDAGEPDAAEDAGGDAAADGGTDAAFDA